jgi:hypothetical protein
VGGWVLLLRRPASDPLFDEAARKYGTTTGYHGSAAENFWSILCT